MRINFVFGRICLLFVVSFSICAGTQKTSMIKDQTPVVDFCELVKNPKNYFDRQIKLAAILTLKDEGIDLSDEKCPLNHDDEIGVEFDRGNQEAWENNMKKVRLMMTMEYGSKAIVNVSGVLRNQSRRDFIWYGLLFEINNIESFSHIVKPYQGALEGANTYRAFVKYDKKSGLALTAPFPQPANYSVEFEWINLKEFSELQNLRKSPVTKEIVFSVISKESKQMTVSRWNMIIRCKIIRIE